MKILLKFPSRGRPTHFLARLKEWIDSAAKPAQIAFLVSYDADDATMTPAVIAQAEALHPSMICVKGNSRTKIEACNADLNEYQADWDVVLLISDDMWVTQKGWDQAIRHNMAQHYPDTDGVLWFWDGAQKHIMTLSCIGRRYYERDRCVYQKDYASFFCDNEATDVAIARRKLTFVPRSIAEHHHPAWLGGMQRDATYVRNNKFWAQDEATYHRRKAAGFPV